MIRLPESTQLKQGWNLRETVRKTLMNLHYVFRQKHIYLRKRRFEAQVRFCYLYQDSQHQEYMLCFKNQINVNVFILNLIFFHSIKLQIHLHPLFFKTVFPALYNVNSSSLQPLILDYISLPYLVRYEVTAFTKMERLLHKKS